MSSYFFFTGVLAFFSSFFGSVYENNTALDSKEQVVVLEENQMKVVVPENPLARGALKIIPSKKEKKLLDFDDTYHKETYQLIRVVAEAFEKRGIVDYVVFSKEINSPKSLSSWEIIPYPKEGWRLWKLFRVLWKMTFGSSTLSHIEQDNISKTFKEEKTSLSGGQSKQITAIQHTLASVDPFCRQEVIDKQKVFEGKEVYVLYNYAPIAFGEEKLHFLIVPKKHRSKFTDLKESEYLEAMQLSKKLICLYKDQYPTSYLFHKTGEEAGQTVPHWHEHLVFTATKTQEFFGKLTVLKNMLFAPSPLSEENLKERVDRLKEKLKEVSY